MKKYTKKYTKTFQAKLGLGKSSQSVSQSPDVSPTLVTSGSTALTPQDPEVSQSLGVTTHTFAKSTPTLSSIQLSDPQSTSLLAVPLSNTSDEPRQSRDFSHAAGMGWKGFKLALGVLEKSSAFFGPLHSAVGGLLEVIKVIDRVSANQKGLETMAKRIERLAQVVDGYSTSSVPKHVQDTIDAISQSIERHNKFIEERVNNCLVERVLSVADYENDIINSLHEITFAIDLFEMRTSISIEVQGRQTQKMLTDLYDLESNRYKLELLKKLESVDEASYDVGTRPRCLDGTRVDTLTRLLAWADDPASRPIFWLSGMAGTGKSAIAVSFCKMIDDGRLGASFFCSRQSDNLNKVNRILPTIAYQLAHCSEGYLEALVKLLKQRRIPYTSATLREQAEDLYINLKGALEARPLIIVIDALDECSGLSDVTDLLRVVLRSNLPIKFLITGRPETHINEGFSAQEIIGIDDELAKHRAFLPGILSHALLRLHDIENDVVEKDIALYLRDRLFLTLEHIDTIRADSNFGMESGITFYDRDEQLPPLERMDGKTTESGHRDNLSTLEQMQGKAEDNLHALIKKSGNLFVFASAAAKYILSTTSANPSPTDTLRRLYTILRSSSEGRLSTKVMDSLYQQIFTSAYYDKEQSEIKSLRATLDTVLCLYRPQSISVIATLLGSHKRDVLAHLRNFASVFSIPDDDHEPVVVFHTSFLEYVRNTNQSGKLALDTVERHKHLASACLRLMNASLKENICSIERRQTPNTDVAESVIHSQIPPALRYACVYWASHLAEGAEVEKVDQSVIQELKIFVNVHLLHWLECLSLVQGLRVAHDCVQRARRYLIQCNLSDAHFGGMHDILLDAEYMIPQVYYFLKLHALEIYGSALVWLPSKSGLKAKYGQKPISHVVCGLDYYWNACLQMLQIMRRVQCVALSPNGIHLACGADSDVQIWDLETGELLKELDGHTDLVTSVAFSPNGLLLASGSCDKTARIWNIATGVVQVLNDHDGWVLAIMFSPDGSKLASGSDDETIRVWNVATGEMIQELKGHTGQILSVAFLIGGSMLASGSGDTTIRIWNASTGKVIQELNGHTGQVLSVAFSPNKLLLASGSDDGTARIWNANNGKLVKELDGLEGLVLSVTFSPNGSKLATASDRTVRIWNVASGELVQELSGHTGWVLSVAFLPDGSKLASASGDTTVRIWNAENSEPIQEGNFHTSHVFSVAFSLDGSKLASASWDENVRIWNANTGGLITELLLQDHVNPVRSLAFSSGGLLLASGSHGEQVIWIAKSNGRHTDVRQGSSQDLSSHLYLGEDLSPADWSIYTPDSTQKCITLFINGAQQPWLWIWGPYFQDVIATSAFTEMKACLGYTNGRIVIVKLLVR